MSLRSIPLALRWIQLSFLRKQQLNPEKIEEKVCSLHTFSSSRTEVISALSALYPKNGLRDSSKQTMSGGVAKYSRASTQGRVHMALSLDSIHQPLNDFFLARFKTDSGSPVVFRFDKFGSILSDEDFIDPSHPELGYLPGLAREKFSDLVNHIPSEEGDGLNLVISQNSIDETYFFHLLSPSSPFIPEGTDNQTRDTIVAAFSTLKADAKKIWDSMTLESSTGLMLQYKPSLAAPENWYDKSRSELWSRQAFQVTQTVVVPAD